MSKGFLVISNNGIMSKIPFGEIVHVESNGFHSNIHTFSGMKYCSFKPLENIFKEIEKTGLFYSYWIRNTLAK